MAPKTPDAFESARQTAEQMTERTQETITNYFSLASERHANVSVGQHGSE